VKTLYLFDFDGTLSKIDSSKFFYRKISKGIRFFLYYYVLSFIPLVKYFFFRGENFEIKKRRFKLFITHCSRLKIKAFLENSDQYIDSILKEEATPLIRRIKAEPENDVFIVSAGISIILENWAKREGLGLITNVPQFLSDDFKTFISFRDDYDCDKIGKVLRIKKELDLNEYDRIFSYGDSSNDFFMFEISDKFFYKTLELI